MSKERNQNNFWDADEFLRRGNSRKAQLRKMKEDKHRAKQKARSAHWRDEVAREWEER